MSAEFQPERENHIGRRANARARMCLPVKLMFPDRTCTCILENLSSGGARIHIDPAPRLGSGAFLQCADIELFCTVVWTHGAKSGLAFDMPLSKDVVVAVRTFADNYANIAQAEMQREANGWVEGRGRVGIGD